MPQFLSCEALHIFLNLTSFNFDLWHILETKVHIYVVHFFLKSTCILPFQMPPVSHYKLEQIRANKNPVKDATGFQTQSAGKLSLFYKEDGFQNQP